MAGSPPATLAFLICFDISITDCTDFPDFKIRAICAKSLLRKKHYDLFLPPSVALPVNFLSFKLRNRRRPDQTGSRSESTNRSGVHEQDSRVYNRALLQLAPD